MKNSALTQLLIYTLLQFTSALAVELPDAAIAEFLKEHELPLIQAGSGTRRQHDVEAQWLKWFERTVTLPFATRLQTDAATRMRAGALVRKGIMEVRQSPQRDPAFTADVMMTECEALLEAKVDDPLVYWLYSRAIYGNTQDFPGFEAAHKKAVRHPQFKSMPAAQRLLTLTGFNRIMLDSRRSTSGMMPKGEEIIEAALLTLQEGSFTTDEDDILDENLLPVFREKVLSKDEAQVQKICSLPTLSPWAKQMLNGRYYECKAWLERGQAFASEVKPEGWLGFEESRVKAVECFKQAWALRPELPAAARELLGISMTGGNTGEKPQAWLKRSLDAQFDYLPTFRALLNGLQPRWGGSHRQMLACGFACAATKRFDTEVPYFFFEVLRDLAKDAADWREVCRDPLVAKVAVALGKQRVQDAPTPELKREALIMLGSQAWLCGDYVAAADALAAAPGKFPRPVVLYLLAFQNWTEKKIRAESSIFAVGYETEWRAAESALEVKNLASAEDGFRTIRSQLNGVAGAEMADSYLAAIKFERELAGGGWVPLRIDSSLAGWEIGKGTWIGTTEGHLINHGHGTSAFISHMGRVGTEFQMRGEFVAGKSGIGMLTNFGKSESLSQWVTCMFKHDRADILDRYFTSGVPMSKIKVPPGPITYLITCHNGKITFEINGQKAFTEVVPTDYYAPQSPLPLFQDGRVGYFHPMISKDNLTKILHTEVRLLPPDFKPER